MDKKKLYKSTDQKVIFGVCGGIAEYLDIDPTIVRILWVVATCFAGAGVIAYLLAALIMPKKPEE